MNKFLKCFIATILSVTTISMLSCGANKKDSSKVDDNKNTEIKGEVVYACPENQVETTEEMVETFKKVYPNVNVKVEGYPGFDVDTYMSTKGASGEMPDLVEGYQSMTYPLSQGWVQALDEFVENDEEFKYISKEILKDCIVNDKLYSLPSKLTLDGVILNLDLLEQLNLDPPEYTWTVDTFLDYAKKATSNTTSGLEWFPEFERQFMGIFSDNGGAFGYDSTKSEFNFTTSAFEKTFTLKNDLSKVPGLLAESLKNQKLRDEGKEDDYQKKFGKEGKGFEDGKILMNGVGLCNLDWLNPQFKYDFYPLPIDPKVGYKQMVHVDTIYMTTGVKDENKQAAFEFLKWVTYGVDGTLSKFKLREDMENPIPRVMLPSTSHPKVEEYYNNLDIPNGVKYMYANLDKSCKGDFFKVIPGMNSVMNDILIPQFNEINKGTIDPSSIAKELTEKANSQIKESKEKFNELIK